MEQRLSHAVNQSVPRCWALVMHTGLMFADWCHLEDWIHMIRNGTFRGVRTTEHVAQLVRLICSLQLTRAH